MNNKSKKQFNILISSAFLALAPFSTSLAESPREFSSGVRIKDEINISKEKSNHIDDTDFSPFDIKFNSNTIDIVLDGKYGPPIITKSSIDGFWEGWVKFNKNLYIKDQITSVPEAGIREISIEKVNKLISYNRVEFKSEIIECRLELKFF